MITDPLTYQKAIQVHIDTLVPIFARAAIGDFSANIDISKNEDEFTPILTGVQLMLEVIREKIEESNAINTRLKVRMEETTALLKSIGDGVAVLDTDGQVVFLNVAGERMMGIKESEVAGHRWVDLAPLQDESGALVPNDERPFEAKYVIPAEAPASEQTLYYVRKNGTRFATQTTVSPVIFEGKRTGIIIVFRDITRQKELEHLKDEFLSIAAHELRSPLGTMRWTMDFLRTKEEREKLPPEIREKIETLYTNNVQMIGLVNDILSIARLTAPETIKEDITPTVFTNVINTVISELEVEIAAHHLTIQFLVKDESLSGASFLVDETHFRQVIQNLLSNAIKYNRDGGTITVTLLQSASEVCIEVADTGMGIEEKDKEHIFERFYRSDAMDERGIPGTGLGLYVVQSYIKKWGAKISFESTVGKGTTFHLCLPKTEAAIQA